MPAILAMVYFIKVDVSSVGFFNYFTIFLMYYLVAVRSVSVTTFITSLDISDCGNILIYQICLFCIVKPFNNNK